MRKRIELPYDRERKRIDLSADQERELVALLARGATRKEACAVVGVSDWVLSPQYHDKRFLVRARAAARRGRSAMARQRTQTEREQTAEEAAIQAEVDHALRGLTNYAEAARRIGVSHEHVRKMASGGRLAKITTPAGPLVKVGER